MYAVTGVFIVLVYRMCMQGDDSMRQEGDRNVCKVMEVSTGYAR